jgi:ABC-type transport system involved in cytochrome c biogenesis permease component
MLKKEFLDASGKFLECIVILVALPLAFVLNKLVFHDNWDFHLIFKVFYIITAILYAAYSGSTFFQSERRDHAFEYLFSLPLPRWKIALYKIVPRLVLLILLISVAPFFSLFENTIIAGFNLITLFFISVFLSIAVSSAFIGILGSGTLYLLYYALYRTISYSCSEDCRFCFYA